MITARLREQGGTDCELVDLAGATVEDVYRALRERHPGLGANLTLVRPARNKDFSEWSDRVADGDEVAFIPPVSGGSLSSALIELTAQPLDPRRLEAAPGRGGICTFTGVVRDNARGEAVTHLEYEAYAGMAERQMRAMAGEIAGRWPDAHVVIAHRTGRHEIGEASVVVSVSCPHRAEAIAACK